MTPQLDAAPEATRALRPIAVWRRRRHVMVVAAAVTFVLAVLAVKALPVSYTATNRSEAVGTEVDPLFGGTGGRTPEKELEVLLTEFSDDSLAGRAAELVGVDPDDVDLVVTSPRETLAVDVAVTAGDRAVAVAVADTIPELVAQDRLAALEDAAEQAAGELRTRAQTALDQAAQQQAEIDRLRAEDADGPLFVEEQVRDALVAKYTQLALQADEVTRVASLRPVGFAITTPAEESVRTRPPDGLSLYLLAAFVAIVAGLAVAMGRELVGDRIQAENLDDHGTGRHLGRIHHTGENLWRPDLGEVAGRLRTLPALQGRVPVLLSVVALGVAPGVVSRTVGGLASWFGLSGIDAPVVDVDFTDVLAEPPGRDGRAGAPGPAESATVSDSDPFVMAESRDRMSPVVGAGHRVIEIRRAGGTILGAAYSDRAVDGITGYRRNHDVVFLDATRSGVTWWAETTFRPEFALVLLGGGVASHAHYDAVRTRLAELAVPVLTIVLEPARWSSLHRARRLVLSRLAPLRERLAARRGVRAPVAERSGIE
ncbi:hypothetical protein [Salsipaludibacter albus]|uniref:hypothetical protein n=1 Tax=Salsipaludibacter albus TaxID=2849650 RepID=UPI001EE4CA56|nr:hypothetical protein [Salsipaludibacter albus]MBY5161757.1 hypothetical protein [Salsipaludibacter albus]